MDKNEFISLVRMSTSNDADDNKLAAGIVDSKFNSDTKKDPYLWAIYFMLMTNYEEMKMHHAVYSIEENDRLNKIVDICDSENLYYKSNLPNTENNINRLYDKLSEFI